MDIPKTVLDVRLTRDAVVALYALVLYEFLIIFDREYETIYKSRWSLTKYLYLASRFGLLLGWPIVMYNYLIDHDMEFCKPSLVIVSVLSVLFPCFAHCIFILRAYAITGAKRTSLLIYLPSFFAFIFVLCWCLLGKMMLREDLFLILGRTGCFRAFPFGPGNLFPVPFTAIALDGVIGLMLVIYFVRSPCPQTRLENLLITQGLIYLPLIFLLNTGAAVISTVGTSSGYKFLVFNSVVVISNIMACRFIIQIREHASNDSYSPEMTSMVTTGVECVFPIGSSATGTVWDSLALSSNRGLSKV